MRKARAGPSRRRVPERTFGARCGAHDVPERAAVFELCQPRGIPKAMPATSAATLTVAPIHNGAG